jgi:hypothetical protein
MEYIEKIKKMLCKELDEYAMKGKLTMADLEPVHLMTDIIKNLDKISMLEEDEGGYSEARGGMRGRYYMHGSSYDDDMMYSERRGRGRNAKRDSMGRYSSEDGMSYDDYSEENSYRGGSPYRSGSSYAEGKDRMMSRLGEMMENADPKEREALKECMRAIERA